MNNLQHHDLFSPVEASEWDGLIYGWITGGVSEQQPVMSGAEQLTDEQRHCLVARVNQVQSTFVDGSLSFELWVLEDEQPVSERIASIVAWCGGFLSGYAEVTDLNKPSTEQQEIIEDLIAITQIDQDIAADEEVEQDLATLVEHIRVCIGLLYEQGNKEQSQEQDEHDDNQ